MIWSHKPLDRVGANRRDRSCDRIPRKSNASLSKHPTSDSKNGDKNNGAKHIGPKE
jgi:hypothetical protein